MLEDAKKKGKKSNKDSKKVSPGKSQDGGSRIATARDSKTAMNPHKSSLADVDKDSQRPDSTLAELTDHSAVDDSKKLSTGPHKRGSKDKKHKNEGCETSTEEKSNYEDLDLNEEMKVILKKFTAFDLSFKDISHLLEQWDRTILDLKRASSPEDLSLLVDDDPKPQKRTSKKERE